jgi:hypothetical protein
VAALAICAEKGRAIAATKAAFSKTFLKVFFILGDLVIDLTNLDRFLCKLA